jgi:hypothetical protein
MKRIGYIFGFAVICVQGLISETPRLPSLISADNTYHVTEAGDGIFLWNPSKVLYLKSGTADWKPVQPRGEDAPKFVDLKSVDGSSYLLTTRSVYQLDSEFKWSNLLSTPNAVDLRSLTACGVSPGASAEKILECEVRRG